MIFCIFFFLYYLFVGVEALKLGAKTAKKIFVSGEQITLTTYLGREYSLSGISKIEDISSGQKVKRFRLLFPASCNTLFVVSKGEEYYLPVGEEGVRQLESLILQKKQV